MYLYCLYNSPSNTNCRTGFMCVDDLIFLTVSIGTHIILIDFIDKMSNRQRQGRYFVYIDSFTFVIYPPNYSFIVKQLSF